jgi:hypothetical protein
VLARSMLRSAAYHPEEMLLNRLPFLLVIVVALLLGACASEDAASAEADGSEAAEPSVAASEPAEPSEAEEPSEEPDASGSAAAFPSFDLNGDPDLAGRFPDTVGGQQLTVTSMRGDQMAGLGGSDPTFQQFLDSIGAELSDVSFAFGGTVDPGNANAVFSIGAFRVLGASEDDLEREFIAASEEAGDITGGLDEANVGGKDVLTAVDPSGETELMFYLYTQDDTLYFLTGTEEQAAEVLEVLP